MKYQPFRLRASRTLIEAQRGPEYAASIERPTPSSRGRALWFFTLLIALTAFFWLVLEA